MSTTVLFIAGTGRSGSTVLANILGEVDGVFTAGEVRYLWQRGMLESRLCGCGVPVHECPMWSRIVAAPGTPQARHDADAMVRLLRRTGRLRKVPLMLGGRRWPSMDPAHAMASAADRDAIGALYARMALVSGSRVVVDSSKLPAYANLLAQIPEIDLRVIHLIRDPRAAAHSWSSRKPIADGAEQLHMERIGPAKSALLWDVWNLSTGALFNRGSSAYLRLRYEDFVADPVAALRRILAMVGMDGAELPFVGPGEVRLGVNHTVAGNPDRLRHGVIRLQADERWLSAMPARDRRVVSAMTAPLLLRYGYAARASGAGPPAETIFERAPVAETDADRFRRRLRRHLRWSRTEGIGKLVEEDELNPITRTRVSVDKWRWRARHAVATGTAMPVYVVGLQRSGTNMLARGLDAAPEFEVRNENDSAAFDRFMLRPDDVVRRIILHSRHRYVLFKPLCDSHRVDQLLDGIDTPTRARAIWAFRDVDGRGRSALSKFGRNNLLVLRDIAAGKGAGMWQAQGLSDTTLEALRGFDFAQMSPESAAALFWWMRNGLYFELGLDQRSDVLLASYADFLKDAASAMRVICAFLDLDYRPALIAHVSQRSSGSRLLDIDPGVRALCDQLQGRLDESLHRQRQRHAA
jgi:hypothetical protein